MADAKFKATLPKDDDANGLAGPDWNRRLLEHVDDEHVAIVTFRAVDAQGLPGYQRAVAGFTRFEPVTDEAEAEVLRQKLAAFSAERRGLTQLPIEGPSARVTPLPDPLSVDGVLPVSDPEGGDAA